MQLPHYGRLICVHFYLCGWVERREPPTGLFDDPCFGQAVKSSLSTRDNGRQAYRRTEGKWMDRSTDRQVHHFDVLWQHDVDVLFSLVEHDDDLADVLGPEEVHAAQHHRRLPAARSTH
jgi:hypothetical protein